MKKHNLGHSIFLLFLFKCLDYFVPSFPSFMIPSLNPRPTFTKKNKQKRKGLTESMFAFFLKSSIILKVDHSNTFSFADFKCFNYKTILKRLKKCLLNI